MQETRCPTPELGGSRRCEGQLAYSQTSLSGSFMSIFWLQGKCLLLLLQTDDFPQLWGFKRSVVIKGLGRALEFFCYYYEFPCKNVAIRKTTKQCMENMCSRSKSSLFQQNFLSFLPNDLNIHLHSLLQKHICRRNEHEERQPLQWEAT